MAISEIKGVRITDIAACVPSLIISNNSLDLKEQERKLLIKTTGVQERRIADANTATSDLCEQAAREIFNNSELSPDDIDVLIFVSQSSDYYLPATAIILQDRLSLKKETIAFDIGLGCSGYIYGLAIISSLLKTLSLRKGLLLVGDISSVTCSEKDKTTYPLFGDAGTATVVERDEGEQSVFFSLMSDGSRYKSIIIPDGGIRNRLNEESLHYKPVTADIYRRGVDLILDGDAVFTFAISEIPASIRQLLQQHDYTIDHIDYFVMHQANRILNETIRKKLKISSEKTPYSIDRFGNTSSASIPLTIVTELKDALLHKKPAMTLISGFGVGLSWGSAILNLGGLRCHDLVEY